MDEFVSKSQKKREADELQKVGVKFIELSLSKLDTLPLPENLLKAIIDAKTIKSNGAKRRQAQLIGKLMRAADHEAILLAYEQIIAEESSMTQRFQEVEAWRDRLIQEGNNALTDFISLYHPQDVQQLRHYIKKAQEELVMKKNTGAAKALFRNIRSCIK